MSKHEEIKVECENCGKVTVPYNVCGSLLCYKCAREWESMDPENIRDY